MTISRTVTWTSEPQLNAGPPGMNCSGNEHFIVTVDGMYGGYASIHNALDIPVGETPQQPRGHTQLVASRFNAASCLSPSIMPFSAISRGLNERRERAGKFNIFIPGEWYLHACHALVDELSDSVPVRLVHRSWDPSSMRSYGASTWDKFFQSA